jgi:hypothetical protein
MVEAPKMMDEGTNIPKTIHPALFPDALRSGPDNKTILHFGKLHPIFI